MLKYGFILNASSNVRLTVVSVIEWDYIPMACLILIILLGLIAYTLAGIICCKVPLLSFSWYNILCRCISVPFVGKFDN